MKLKPYTAAPLAAAGCLFLTLVYGMVSSTADLPAAWRLPVLALAQTVSCMLPAVLFTLGFSLTGFADDFIKVVLHRPEGLSFWQKILLQLALSIGAAFFSAA